MTWVLIIWFISPENSSTISVPGYTTPQFCESAAAKVKTLESLVAVRIRTLCLPQQ